MGNTMPKYFSLVCCSMCKFETTTSNLSQHHRSKHEFIFPPRPKRVGKCLQCSNIIQGYYLDKNRKFCSKSCSATHSNLNSSPTRKRGPLPKNFQHLSKKERMKENSKIKRWTFNICGPYSKLYKSKCSICQKISFGSKWKKFCENHKNNYSHSQRAKYWFTFALTDYPDLFDFTLLRNYGMRSASNPYGVVRDHRVSVSDSIKHNYDPYYIKHPINCELMLHSDNCKKYTRSSISYAQLKQLVDAYELSKIGALTRN